MRLSKFKGIYVGLVVAFGLAFIILGIFFTKNKENGRYFRKFCRFFFPACGIKIDKIGEFDLNATLVIMNHQSYSDIIFLEGLHPRNICWVAKKQLGEIPFYGHALKGPQMILIDREDKRGLASLLKEAKVRIDEHRPLVIFPEGTRSEGKEKFLPFKLGAKILAEKFKLRVQPVVLVNTRKVFNTSPLESLSDSMRAIILPSFEPECRTDWFDRIEIQMQEVYLKHYKELNPD